MRRCSFVRAILLHGFFLQVACFSDKEGQTFKNEQSVVEIKVVQSHKTITAASIPCIFP